MASVDHSGNHPRIKSAELADREWQLGTQDNDHNSTDPLGGVPAFAVSRARLQAAKASIATMELLEKKRQLIPIEEVRKQVGDVFATVRTRLLAIPTDARQRIHKLDDSDVAVLDALVREALEHLAGKIG